MMRWLKIRMKLVIAVVEKRIELVEKNFCIVGEISVEIFGGSSGCD
jgi:hypothetical protein